MRRIITFFSSLVLLVALIFATSFITPLKIAAQVNPTNQAETLQANIQLFFQQTAQAQQATTEAATRQANRVLPMTATAEYQETLRAAFNAALTATAIAEHPAPTALPPVLASVNTGGSVNVRSCPSTNCEVVGAVGPTEQFTILLVENDWYMVNLPNQSVGYIYSPLVTLPEGADLSQLPTLTPSPSPSPTFTPSPTSLPPTPTPNISLTATFETLGDLVTPKRDGFYVVGVDIQPGRWESTGNGANCYWERLSENGDILGNYFGTAGGIITIQPSDFQVQFEDCGTVRYIENEPNLLQPDAYDRKSNGIYRVGVEIGPGRWRSTGQGSDCYWERLNGFQGIIDNHYGNAGGAIFISPSDVEFAIRDCGFLEYQGQ